MFKMLNSLIHYAITPLESFQKNNDKIYQFNVYVLVMACHEKFMSILKSIDSEYPASHAARVLTILEQKVSFWND